MRASFLVGECLADECWKISKAFLSLNCLRYDRPFCILNFNDSCFIDIEVGRRGGCS